MKITFLGASKTVTGSCFLVETKEAKFLVDCGMFQGGDIESRNFLDFKFNPETIDFVVLTHSHIDHSGLLPKLVKAGFNGPIYMSPQTANITQLLLLDSAKIQETNLKMGISQNLLYGTRDSENTINLFHTKQISEEFSPKKNIKIKLVRVGHVMGATSILIKADSKLIVFSGDIGRQDQTLIKSFDKTNWNFKDAASKIDAAVMESLYGGIEHPDKSWSIKELLTVIDVVSKRNGIVMIPAFALHKTQEILLILKNAFANNDIKDNVQVFLDSPLSDKITSIYTQNPGELNSDNESEKHLILEKNNEPFYFDNLQIVRQYKESLELYNKKPSVILAGSGMANGGRILRHMYSLLGSHNNAIIFVGFQAEGTTGRTVVDGAKELVLLNKKIKVNAGVYYLRGFSAHGDNEDLITWLENIPMKDEKNTFLIHAEPERLEIFNEILSKKGYKITMPSLEESFEI